MGRNRVDAFVENFSAKLKKYFTKCCENFISKSKSTSQQNTQQNPRILFRQLSNIFFQNSWLPSFSWAKRKIKGDG